MIADKKQWFFKRDFFQIGIEDTPEKHPECKRRQYIFQKPGKH
jgi:hypothetical protein